MEMMQEVVFDTIPTFDEVNSIVEGNPNAFINLANVSPGFYLCEIEYLSVFSHNINGLNILFDCDDESELELIWTFHNLAYLRIEFQHQSVQFENYFLSWLINENELQALSLETNPDIYGDGISLLATYLGNSNKKRPVSLFINNEHDNHLIDFNCYPMLRVFEAKNSRKAKGRRLGNRNYKVELSAKGLQQQLMKGKTLKKIDPLELQFVGFFDIKDDDWELKAQSFSFNAYKEIIFMLQGVDESGEFSCEGRCNWNDAENGFYFASKIPIKYNDYTHDDNFCSIKLTSVFISSNGECLVTGEWLQNGYSWKISAALENKKKVARGLELEKEISLQL
ncbi:hypothetical protein ACROAE_00280 [Shewanella sp. MF05960]|uniref:hypothetical protein n=1 Tax=Shewanella sp. MF05960 TaxID=3434874 RepID=UPI003D7C0982